MLWLFPLTFSVQCLDIVIEKMHATVAKGRQCMLWVDHSLGLPQDKRLGIKLAGIWINCDQRNFLCHRVWVCGVSMWCWTAHLYNQTQTIKKTIYGYLRRWANEVPIGWLCVSLWFKSEIKTSISHFIIICVYVYAGIILILNCANYLIKCGGMINYLIATWLKAGGNLIPQCLLLVVLNSIIEW